MGRLSSGTIGQDQGRTFLSSHLILLWSWSSYDYHLAVWCKSGRTKSLATRGRRHRQRGNYGHGIKITHRRQVSIFQYWKGMPGSNGSNTPASQKSEWCSPDCNRHFVTDKSYPMSIDLVKSMRVLKEIIYNGWPSRRNECPKELWEYWNHKWDLTWEDGVILKSDRIVVPESLRGQVLELMHSGHQGETKCLLLASQSVYWLDISGGIREMVKECEPWNKYQQAQQKLTAIQPELPTRQWEKLGIDIFEFNGSKYLMVVDYYILKVSICEQTAMGAKFLGATFVDTRDELTCLPLAKNWQQNWQRVFGRTTSEYANLWTIPRCGPITWAKWETWQIIEPG